MRISDWSSDVCSSDLGVQPVGDLPIVLREDRPGRALERRRGVVDVAGGGEIALGTDRLTQGELLRRRVGFPPIRQQAFAQSVDVLEIERAGRRSAARRVGKEGGSTCRSGGARDHEKKKRNQ